MKFWFLLWVLGLRMSWLSRKNEDFQRKLEGQDIVLQFRTESGNVARHYVVKNGNVHANPGLADSPSMTLAFRDAEFAYDTIMAASKDPSIFMQGMQAQDIKVTGDVGLMMWFMGLMKYLPPKKKKKK